MSAKDVIDARPETVSTLITFSSTRNSIIVPIYQRLYQWDTSKLIDILRLTDPDTRDFGFIGTMVFVNKNQSLEVVDGQQRLISIILILCALRDYIKEYIAMCGDETVNNKLREMASDIQRESLIVSRSYSGVSDIPRVIFHRSSYDVFKNKFLLANFDYVADEIIEKKN